MLYIDKYETPEDDKVLRGRVLAVLALCKQKSLLYPSEIVAMLGGNELELRKEDEISKLKEDIYVDR